MLRIVSKKIAMAARKPPRQKLYDGARIYHPGLRGNSKVEPLTVRVTHRPNAVPEPFDYWEVYTSQGKLATGSARSERGLDRILRFHGTYKIISPDEQYLGVITHVAIKDTTGNVWSLPKPHRHGDVIKLIQQQPNAKDLLSRAIEGFLNDAGEFLNRKDAWHAAHKNKQILPPYNPVDPSQRAWDAEPSSEPADLFSEDVW
jgi:hypothetical protein